MDESIDDFPSSPQPDNCSPLSQFESPSSSFQRSFLTKDERTARMENDDYNAIIERYRRGDHIFKNAAKEEREDISLEFEMYIKASKVIKNEPLMRDYDSNMHGEVRLPELCREERDKLDAREIYIATNQALIEAMDTYYPGTSTQTFEEIYAAELADTRVYGWVIGRLNADNAVSNMIFGQFTRSIVPPKEGWIYCGKNINANVPANDDTLPVRTEKSDYEVSLYDFKDEEMKEERPFSPPESATNADPFDKLDPSTMLPPMQHTINLPNPFLVSESLMESMVYDEVRCEEAEGITLPSHRGTPIHLGIFRIEGCSLQEINGRYVEWGRSSGAIRYKNTKDWVLLRLSLSEIPELGIRAVDCYSALDGEPVLDVMERRTDKAVTALLNPELQIEEGSMVFKEKFAEISRFGSRLINYDQTFQLLRNNDLKANVRQKASRALLLQLLALKSTEEKTENDEEENISSHILTNSARGHINDEQHKVDVISEEIHTQEKKGEIDVDIETTLSRSTMYQTGSQGYGISVDKVFLAQESELGKEVTLRIEQREKLLFEVSLEAERVHRNFIENQEVDTHNKNFVVISDLLRKMDDLREATINVTESLGAWIRLCLKKRKQFKTLALKESGATRVPRDYCVVIAVRGIELYPASEAIVSGVKKYRRSRQERKVSTDVQYVGIYKRKQEAIDMFLHACSKVPLEKRPFAYSGQPPMFIGLRECGNHYLVRSDGVPSDLPCEQCQAAKFNKPSDIVNASASDILPQFIWHGVNYLEKMWSDLNFLEKSAPLKKYFPEFGVHANPLLLDRQAYYDGLESIGISTSDPLDTLQGRMEQVEEAVKASVIIQPKVNKWNFMGTPYVENMVSTFVKAKAAEFQAMKLERIEQHKKQVAKSIGTASTTTETDVDYVGVHSTLYSDIMRFSPSTTLPGPEGVQFTDEESDQRRLHRALGVLCQVSSLAVEELPQEVRTDRLNMSTLQRLPLKRPTLPSEIKKKLAQGLAYKPQGTSESFERTKSEGVLVKSRYPDSGIDGNFVMTETSYEERGAKLRTTQLRAPIAHRNNDIWCRTDVGEWKGLSKGRNMRSYEFQERLKILSKFLISERLRMQNSIRSALEIHFADCSVPFLCALITEAQAIRGTLLKLDIAQAELYLQKREKVIAILTRVKARLWGVKARRRVQNIRHTLNWNSEQKRLTEELAYETARIIIPPLIHSCQQRIAKQFSRMMGRCSFMIGGSIYVVSIYALPRKAIRNEVKSAVCMSCMTQSSVKVYNPKKHKHESKRAICTCQLVQGTEKVLFRLYDPLTKRSFYKTLTERDIRDNIKFVHSTSKISVEERRINLIGESFGKIAPLFASRREKMDNIYSRKDMAFGLLTASTENSVLPLLVKKIPIDLLRAADCILRVNMKTIQNFYQIESTIGPVTVANVLANDTLVELKSSSHWEIFTNLRFTIRQLEKVMHTQQVLVDRADESEAAYHRRYAEEAIARITFDRDCMSFEDIRTQVILTYQKLVQAKKNIVDVVSFSKYGVEKLTNEEENVREDWSQSHDGFENGNAWIGLNNQRRLEKLLKEMVSVFLIRYQQSLVSEPILSSSLANMHAQYKLMSDDRVAALAYRPTVGLLMGMKNTMEKSIGGLAKIVLSRYYVPYVPLVKQRPRYLRRADLNGVYIRDEMTRAQKPYRYLWNLVERKVVGVQIASSPFEKGKVVRVVACYFVDPLTGNHLLNLMTEDNIIFEECIMHEDFNFSMQEFSEAIATGDVKEILMTPKNVTDFLSRGLDRSLVEIKKPKRANPWMPRKCTDGERRLRNTDHIQVYPASTDRLAALPREFQARRRLKDDELFLNAKIILGSLRLHPYSRRPCLGRLYFDRRIRFITPILRRCKYLNDLTCMRNAMWSNEFFNGLHYLCGKIVKVQIRNDWGYFHFRIVMAGQNSTFLYSLSIQDLIGTYDKRPLLLASFLAEMMTNTFSIDTIAHILSRLDLRLPGEGTFFWRERFELNIPSIKFLSSNDENERYRGPVYCFYRFMSGCYIAVEVYTSASSDLRIIIKAPKDGKFSFHLYAGEDIVIDISRLEVISFVSALASRTGVSQPKAWELLYTYNTEELLRELLKDISIPLYCAPPPPRTLSHISLIDLHFNILKKEEADTILTRAYLSAKFRLFLRKFTLWTTARTNGRISPLSKEITERLCASVDRIGENERTWDMIQCVNTVNNTSNLLEVFKGIWCTPSPISEHKHINRTESSSPLLNFSILSQRDSSYFSFSVYTDEKKENVYLKIKSSTMNVERFERESSSFELTDMITADHESKQYENFVNDQNHHNFMRNFLIMNEKLFSSSSVELHNLKKKMEYYTRCLHDASTSLHTIISNYSESSAARSYTCVINSIERMTDDFTSFASNDILQREMQRLLDRIIFKSIDTYPILRCTTCKLSFSSKTKLERHVEFAEGHRIEIARQREEAIALELEKVEQIMKIKSEQSVRVLLMKHKRAVRMRARELEEEFDTPPDIMSSEEAWEKAEDEFAEQLTTQLLDIEKSNTEALQKEKDRILLRQTTPDFSPVPVNFLPRELLNFQEYLKELLERFTRQFQMQATEEITIIVPTSTPCVDRFKIRPLSLLLPSHRQLPTTSSLSLEQNFLSRQHAADPGGFRSYASWLKARSVLNATQRPQPLFAAGHILSQPIYGPYDIFSIEFYNPITKIKFRRIFIPPFSLNLMELDVKTSVSSSFSRSNVSGVPTSLANSIERAVAVRLVTFGILTATLSASAKILTCHLEDSLCISALEKTVARQWGNLNGAVNKGDVADLKAKILLSSVSTSLTFKQSKRESMKQNVIVEGPTRSLVTSRRTYGVLVPMDEETAPILFVCSHNWKQDAEKYLDSSIHKERRQLEAVFTYERDTEGAFSSELLTGMKVWREREKNTRLNWWLRLYIEENGWKDGKELEVWKKKYVIEKQKKEQTRELYGDIVMIMRYGERDARRFVDWCIWHYETHQPEKERCRERERKRHEARVKCHQAYRSFLFDFSFPFLSAMEQLFAMGYRHSGSRGEEQENKKDRGRKRDDRQVSPYQARLLLTEYWQCMNDPKFSILIDDAFLMDDDIGLMAENEMLFEGYIAPQANQLSSTIIFTKQRRIELEEGEVIRDLVPSVMQVMYAVIVLHCRSCKVSIGTCMFPCCRLCPPRKLEGERQSELEGETEREVEGIVRHFLLDQNTPLSLARKFPKARSLPREINPDESDEEDKKEKDEIDKEKINKEISETRWKRITQEGAEFRYLNRRLARREYDKIIPRSLYLSMLPGEHFLEENAILGPIRCTSLNNIFNTLTDPLTDSISATASLLPSTTPAAASSDDDACTTLLCLSLTAYKLLVGLSGLSLSSLSLTSGDIDPYPPLLNKTTDGKEREGDHKEVFPMHTSVFEFILNRLSISQCYTERVIGKRERDHVRGDITFDRLIAERVCILSGHLTIVQMLYGHLDGHLAISEDDGYPTAAKRYQSLNNLSLLTQGLTISLYDTLSDFSRCQLIDMQTLRIWTEKLGLADFDLVRLVDVLLERSSEIFTIKRQGRLFIDFTLELNQISILKIPRAPLVREGEGRITWRGRRQAMSVNSTLTMFRNMMKMEKQKQ